ncbi:MAG: hypothetical protein EZS28_023773 [Streblomastix strix]|uniref:Uncharacterized protein n=1 Tax=Streblomastix strix TaxID=222440 RepID=A0A5J4VE37_9EUKA|nr:MAG: hypothetical protein EZS28_023773 [Streblomastix strix]
MNSDIIQNGLVTRGECRGRGEAPLEEGIKTIKEEDRATKIEINHIKIELMHHSRQYQFSLETKIRIFQLALSTHSNAIPYGSGAYEVIIAFLS